jgi:hypothetical protein
VLTFVPAVLQHHRPEALLGSLHPIRYVRCSIDIQTSQVDLPQASEKQSTEMILIDVSAVLPFLRMQFFAICVDQGVVVPQVPYRSLFSVHGWGTRCNN